MLEIRSSSWGDLLDCASRWEAIHVLNMPYPASVPAHIGSSIHSGTARYDQAKVEQRTPNLQEAVAMAVQRFENPHDEIHWTNDDYSKRDAMSIVIKGTEAYCNDLSPRFDFMAVELRPTPLDVQIDGQIIRISGQMDRTRVSRDTDRPGIGIADLKTGRGIIDARGIVNTKGHKFQLGIYELLAENSMGMPVTEDATIAAISTSKKVQTGIGVVKGAKTLMLGTEEQPGIIETVGRMVKAGLFPPNPRSRLCGEKYCPRYHHCTAHD